ncbi:CorA family divalent cation transporter [Bosea eneae]|uniref:CorA family divalent cation transporter n=1 Tax=Bosea eneae TaxID=151454 RepID=A0ABW0IJZ6_9HYPH
MPLPPDIQSQTGIVWAYRFAADGTPTLMPRNEAPTLTPEDGFVWLHLDLVHTRAQAWIDERKELPPAARELLLSRETHQRLDHTGSLVWGIAHDLTRDIVDRTDTIGTLAWAVGERFLLTGRREALQSVRKAVEALNAGERIASPAELFEHLIEYLIDDVTDAVVRLSDETDSVEDQILLDRLEDGPQRVGAVRRSAVQLHRQLAGLHLLFRRFAETPSGRSAPEAVRASALRLLLRVDTLRQDIQSVQDRARLLQDEIAVRSANQTNRQLYVLSILTALFLPATFITGLFGINVKGLPWVEWDFGAGFVALACLAASMLTLFLLRRRGVIGR